MPEYERTQYGKWHWFIWVPVLGLLLAAWITKESVFAFIGAILVFAGLTFGSLTIRDEGDCLAICFGPLPLIRKRIRYANIISVESGRTSILDGWGIHGNVWNVWGFCCVRITLGKKVIRVGTDDVENLVNFVRGKMREYNSDTGRLT